MAKQKMSMEEINKRADKKTRAFVAKRKKRKAENEKVIELAAEKIVSRIIKSNPLKSIEKEIVEQCKKITLAQTIDRLLERKKCPMLSKSDRAWDCSKSGCNKGEETFCDNINFLNCPAINHYFNHQVIAKSLRIKRLSDKAKKEKEAKRKDK